MRTFREVACCWLNAHKTTAIYAPLLHTTHSFAPSCTVELHAETLFVLGQIFSI
jgi:hypothetical protein